MEQRDIDTEEYAEYLRSVQYQNYELQPVPKNKFDFISKIFSSKKKLRRVKSPQIRRIQRSRNVSPQYQRENVFSVNEHQVMYQLEDEVEFQSAGITNSNYNVLFIKRPAVEKVANYSEKENKNLKKNKYSDEVIEKIQKNHKYFEIVKVEDRGTDPWDMTQVEPTIKEDKGTDSMYSWESELSKWKNEKEKLSNELQEKENTIKSCLDEGILLLRDVEKIRKHFSINGKIPEDMKSQLNQIPEIPADFLHMSRACMMELAKQLTANQKQTEAEVQKLKKELNTIKMEKAEKEGKIKILELKIENVDEERKDCGHLQAKIVKLQESLEAGKKLLRESEKIWKGKIENLEIELTAQKQSNTHLTQVLDDKSHFITQLQANVEQIQSSLEASKQQAKDIQYSYKSRIAKLESEYTVKMTTLCENQTQTNKQLSQALDQTSNYVNQIQEIKEQNATLVAANKSVQEKMVLMEREMTKAQERCSAAERKLSRETQEVMALKSQVERLETLSEEELLGVDGDIWCQIMYQHDQWILDDLKTSLQDKESYLESLHAQGDCALKDFEKVQNELQQRRQQFNELKDVFLDFEKKRDIVVREQRDFYNKMLLLSKKTIPRDRFFKNLIEECHLKTVRIEEFEKQIKNTEKVVEETKKNSEAQLKAMQAELNFTMGNLYEFENQVRIKETEIQEAIKVLEQEKKNKTTAEEAMNTYKILLDESRKENAEIRNKLNYLEDLEINRVNGMRKIDDFASDTQEIENLKIRVKDLTENRKYMERILMESQKSKEMLQREYEEFYNKMKQALRVMTESKETQDALESKLEKRTHTIQQLQKSQADTEDQLDLLKDILCDMEQTILLLQEEKEELQNKLSNHINCKAERAIYKELKLLQKDKAIIEEQNSREKELLLHRLKDNDNLMKDQHKHLREIQDQLDSLNTQLGQAKNQLATERHNHTQQLLTLHADKKKLEVYINELEGRVTHDTILTFQTSDTMDSTPIIFNSSDSYEPPNRDYNVHHYQRK